MSIFDKFTALGKSAIGKIKKEPKTEKKEEKKKAGPVEIKEGKRDEKYASLKIKSEEQPGESKEIKAKNVKKTGSARVYKILIKPLITEKATTLVGQNKYAFRVAKNANKIEIKKAIKDLYGFDPIAVNIINERGDKISYGRISGKTSNWKKAIITLKSSDKIELYEGV